MRNQIQKTLLALFLLGIVLIPCLKVQAQAVLTPNDYAEDFDVFWKEIAQSYAYFDKKETDWQRVRETYRPRTATISSKKEFVGLLEEALEELYDFHCNLNTNTESSAVLVPTDADLWAEWRDNHALITEVRTNSPAGRAGIRAGAEVISIEGIPIREAVRLRQGRCLRKPDIAAENWALLTLLAGRHNKKRQMEIIQGTKSATYVLETAHQNFASRLEYSTLGPGGEIGYIRLHNSLGDNSTIPDFDRALATLRKTRGMILDLRETPSGGNTVVARAILGRFLAKEAFYQKHSIPAEERLYGVKRSWVEIVSPRGPFCYDRPLIVLVDHWTGSMGEGIATGFDAMKRATIVGTPMAQLLGATDQAILPHSQIGVHFPTEKLFQPTGKPRENFVPSVYVDCVKSNAPSGTDPILKTGIMLLQKRL